MELEEFKSTFCGVLCKAIGLIEEFEVGGERYDCEQGDALG